MSDHTTFPPATLADIARQVGTPAYIYSQARIEANFGRLKAAFGAESLQCYSVKANGNLSVLCLLRDLGAGFDVVSTGEMGRALAIGADPATIVFAGVGKRDDELASALDAHIGWINVESAQELAVLSDLARAKNIRQRVALRINPAVDPHTHRYLATGKGTSKFGIEMDEALRLVERRADYPGVEINGVHIHIGSMVCETGPYADAMRVALDFIAACRRLGAVMTTFDVGGGFGVAYTADGQTAPVERIAHEIVPLAHAAKVHLLFEPGRSIIADAGVLLTRVLYTKTNGGVHYAVVDAAMNDLIRPALYGAIHAVTPLESGQARDTQDTQDTHPLRTYAIVGPVCESGDKLAEAVQLPELRRGDLLMIHHTGAYGMSMASTYNARPRSAEVLLTARPASSGPIPTLAWRLIRPREALASLWASEVECLNP